MKRYVGSIAFREWLGMTLVSSFLRQQKLYFKFSFRMFHLACNTKWALELFSRLTKPINNQVVANLHGESAITNFQLF